MYTIVFGYYPSLYSMALQCQAILYLLTDKREFCRIVVYPLHFWEFYRTIITEKV